MTFITADRVRETTTTTGTGSVTLAGAVTGFRTFSSVMSTSDTCYYAIVDNAAGAWEVGLGTLSSSTVLARTTLLASSTGSAISFAAGTKDVFLTLPASAPGFTVGPSGQAVVFTAGATSHGMEFGRTDGTPSTPFIDFHAGATPTDYDVRLLASNGSGVDGAGDLTIYLSNLVLGGTIRPMAGTASKAPMAFTSGTLLSAVAGGTREYDGSVFYTTPNSSATGGRAQELNAWHYRVTTAVGLTSGTSVQSLFNKSLTNVPTGSFLVEMFVALATGTTSHTVAVGLGGTATWAAAGTTWKSEFLNVAAAGTPTASTMKFNTTLTSGTTQVISPASTTASKFFKWTGTVTITGAGTLIPQIQFSAAPGGTNQTSVGSWVRVIPIADSVGAWA